MEILSILSILPLKNVRLEILTTKTLSLLTESDLQHSNLDKRYSSELSGNHLKKSSSHLPQIVLDKLKKSISKPKKNLFPNLLTLVHPGYATRHDHVTFGGPTLMTAKMAPAGENTCIEQRQK